MANPYYNASGAPVTGSPGLSAVMRSEFAAINAGFNILPNVLTPNYVVTVNPAGTALITTNTLVGITLTTPTLGDPTTMPDGSIWTATTLTMPSTTAFHLPDGSIWNNLGLQHATTSAVLMPDNAKWTSSGLSFLKIQGATTDLLTVHGTANINTQIAFRNLSNGNASDIWVLLDNTVSQFLMRHNSTTFTPTDYWGQPGISSLYTTGADLRIGTLNPNCPIRFATASTERMYLNTVGQLGIGNVPWGWAHQYPGITVGQCNSFVSALDSSTLFISSNVYFDSSNWRYVTSGAGFYVNQNTAGVSWIMANAGAAGTVVPGFNTVMQLDNSGHLGLGGPPYWAGQYPGIQMGQQSSLVGATDSSLMFHSTNAYFDGANWRYVVTGSGFLTTHGLGVTWASFAAGTAGSVIPGFSTRMSIDPNGNLAVGRDLAATPLSSDYRTIALGYVGSWNATAAAGPGSISLAYNAFFDGANNKFLTNDRAVQMNLTSGDCIWYSSAPGTRGAVIPYVEIAHLNSGGTLAANNFHVPDDVSSGSFQIGNFGAYLARLGAGGYTQIFNSQNGITCITSSNGVVLGSGGSAWGAISSRDVKKDFAEIPGDVFEIILGHEAGLFRYKTDADTVPLRPGLMFEDAKRLYPWATLHTPASTMFDPTKDMDVDVPELKALSLEQYVPLLMAAFKKQIAINAVLEARLTAGGL